MGSDCDAGIGYFNSPLSTPSFASKSGNKHRQFWSDFHLIFQMPLKKVTLNKPLNRRWADFEKSRLLSWSTTRGKCPDLHDDQKFRPGIFGAGNPTYNRLEAEQYPELKNDPWWLLNMKADSSWKEMSVKSQLPVQKIDTVSLFGNDGCWGSERPQRTRLPYWKKAGEDFCDWPESR